MGTPCRSSIERYALEIHFVHDDGQASQGLQQEPLSLPTRDGLAG